jgi:predicted metal-dependent hydrolase
MMKLFGRSAPEPKSIEIGGAQVEIRRMAQARRMRLSIDPRDGLVRLVVPGRSSLKSALAWAETKTDWIAAQRAAVPDVRPIQPGMTIPFEGRPLLIDWQPDHSRRVRREGSRLIVGGPEEMVQGRVLRWLKREALSLLEVETYIFAQKAGVKVEKVGIGDPRSRWGSCSSCASIRYNWRLILAPPQVREATVAHEVAHLLHMDHSPAFHAAVEHLLGRDPKAERRWLRQYGAGLHRIGR